MILKVLKAKLDAVKDHRPAGYAEAVAKAAHRQDEEAYYLSAMDWGRIAREFGVSPNNVVGHNSPAKPTKPQPAKPAPKSEWPAWAKLIALAAKPEDAGVGDTIERTVGKANSAAFKAWFLATFGRSCGCATRQAAWNATYPYQNEKVLALPDHNESA